MKSRKWLFQDLDFAGILKKYNVEFPGAKQKITKIFRSNKKDFGFIPNRCHIILQGFLWKNSFVLSRISKGEITNLEIQVVFFQKVCAPLPSFFWNSPIYRPETNFWWNFCQCAELDPPFLHLLFLMTFSYKRFPSFHTKNFWCYAWTIYILVR